MKSRMTWMVGWGVALVFLLGGCCADPCDPLCPGDPCDSAVGPCDPCACRTSNRPKLVPRRCCVWSGCPDPCDTSIPRSDPCYRDPAEGIGDAPMTIPGVSEGTLPAPVRTPGPRTP